MSQPTKLILAPDGYRGPIAATTGQGHLIRVHACADGHEYGEHFSANRRNGPRYPDPDYTQSTCDVCGHVQAFRREAGTTFRIEITWSEVP